MRIVVVDKQRAHVVVMAGMRFDRSVKALQHAFAAPGGGEADRAVEKHPQFIQRASGEGLRGERRQHRVHHRRARLHVGGHQANKACQLVFLFSH